MSNTLVVLQDVQTILQQRLENEKDGLPLEFNKAKFVLNSIEALKGLDLSKYTPNKIINVLMKGAYLGLDFFRKECYCIPFGSEPQFLTDYKGEVKLAKKFSVKPIFEIYAEVVREGDEYEKITIRGERTINHKPLRFNDNKIEGAYAVVKYKDGATDMVEISVKDIETIRNKYSKAPQSGAWINRYAEMCKKTALRLLCKSIQLDFTSEQFKAYNEGGDCDFVKTQASEEVAINPFETPMVAEQPSEPDVIEAEVVVTPSTSAEAEGVGENQLKCSVCGAEISEKVFSYSSDKFGRPLCFICQKKEK